MQRLLTEIWVEIKLTSTRLTVCSNHKFVKLRRNSTHFCVISSQTTSFPTLTIDYGSLCTQILTMSDWWTPTRDVPQSAGLQIIYLHHDSKYPARLQNLNGRKKWTKLQTKMCEQLKPFAISDRCVKRPRCVFRWEKTIDTVCDDSHIPRTSAYLHQNGLRNTDKFYEWSIEAHDIFWSTTH